MLWCAASPSGMVTRIHFLTDHIQTFALARGVTFCRFRNNVCRKRRRPRLTPPPLVWKPGVYMRPAVHFEGQNIVSATSFGRERDRPVSFLDPAQSVGARCWGWQISTSAALAQPMRRLSLPHPKTFRNSISRSTSERSSKAVPTHFRSIFTITSGALNCRGGQNRAVEHRNGRGHIGSTPQHHLGENAAHVACRADSSKRALTPDAIHRQPRTPNREISSSLPLRTRHARFRPANQVGARHGRIHVEAAAASIRSLGKRPRLSTARNLRGDDHETDHWPASRRTTGDFPTSSSDRRLAPRANESMRNGRLRCPRPEAASFCLVAVSSPPRRWRSVSAKWQVRTSVFGWHGPRFEMTQRPPRPPHTSIDDDGQPPPPRATPRVHARFAASGPGEVSGSHLSARGPAGCSLHHPLPKCLPSIEVRVPTGHLASACRLGGSGPRG